MRNRSRCGVGAPGKLGKGGSKCKAETFRWDPAGNQPRPAERASGRKRVSRGAGATRAAKRSGYRNRSGDASIGGTGETGEVSQPHVQEVIPMGSKAYR